MADFNICSRIFQEELEKITAAVIDDKQSPGPFWRFCLFGTQSRDHRHFTAPDSRPEQKQSKVFPLQA
jgi:hypothetical protein